MTYEKTIHFLKEEGGKTVERITLTIAENLYSFVFHVAPGINENDMLRSFDEVHQGEALILFDNLFRDAMNKYKFYIVRETFTRKYLNK